MALTEYQCLSLPHIFYPPNQNTIATSTDTIAAEIGNDVILKSGKTLLNITILQVPSVSSIDLSDMYKTFLKFNDMPLSKTILQKVSDQYDEKIPVVPRHK